MSLMASRAFAKAFEQADLKSSAIGWADWLADGIAKGGRSVFRWSRGAIGWIPAPRTYTVGDDDQVVPDALPDDEGVPASPQQEVEDQATAWAEQWGCGTDILDTVFPNITAFPDPRTIEDLTDAILSFPRDTALGTDAFHPRALLRMSAAILIAILALFVSCERLGKWPTNVGDVLVAHP